MFTVNEGSTCYLKVDFYDESGKALSPSSVSYRIDDLETGTSILASTSVAPASSITITISPSDNAMVNSGLSTETHRITVQAPFRYHEQINGQYDYQVANLTFYT